MTDHKLGVNEGVNPADSTNPVDAEPERHTYAVVNPIFKHGKQYRKGSNIDLDAATAAAFLAVGDIKEKP